MAQPNRFTIQRDDGTWYAGTTADGSSLWVADVRQAHRFVEYVEALDVLQRLPDDRGHARIFAETET